MSIDLSLDRLQQLVTHLPPYTRPTLHIAGTNGKGSVSALLTSILLSSDPPLRVGRYNSPHLVSIYDSITLDNVPVSASLYTSIRTEVEDADKAHGTKLSSFELLTLTALRVFEVEKVDIVVLEVGMGGRLDATNIIPDETIAVSALTAVDLDHQFFLGDTVRQIAREKAGIGRKGRPFVLGKQRNDGVEAEVKDVLASVGTKLTKALVVQTREWDETIDGPKIAPFSLANADAVFERPSPEPVSAKLGIFPTPIQALLPLYGAHQIDNLGIALSVIDELATSLPIFKERLTPRTIANGIKNVRWPGRLSFHTLHVSVPSQSTSSPVPTSIKLKKHPLIVLADGAHNPASAETLGAYVSHLLELAVKTVSAPTNINITYILSLSHSPPKTPLQTLSPVLPPKLLTSTQNITLSTSVALLRFTPPEGMPWVKSVSPSEMESVVQELVPEAEVWVGTEEVYPTASKNVALEEALRWAAERQDRHDEGLGLVVLAGSLYLVADFYRLLEEEEKVEVVVG